MHDVSLAMIAAFMQQLISFATYRQCNKEWTAGQPGDLRSCFCQRTRTRHLKQTLLLCSSQQSTACLIILPHHLSMNLVN